MVELDPDGWTTVVGRKSGKAMLGKVPEEKDLVKRGGRAGQGRDSKSEEHNSTRHSLDTAGRTRTVVSGHTVGSSGFERDGSESGDLSPCSSNASSASSFMAGYDGEVDWRKQRFRKEKPKRQSTISPEVFLKSFSNEISLTLRELKHSNDVPSAVTRLFEAYADCPEGTHGRAFCNLLGAVAEESEAARPQAISALLQLTQEGDANGLRGSVPQAVEIFLEEWYEDLQIDIPKLPIILENILQQLSALEITILSQAQRDEFLKLVKK